MTDNGSAYVSYKFRDFCEWIGVRHIRIEPHRPQTNGKVERMIQTLLREWAYHTQLLTTMRRSVAWIGRTS